VEEKPDEIGQALLRGRVGVFSFARYDPAFHGGERGEDGGQLLLKRSARVLVHETAHMFGVGHCIFYKCVMNGSNHLAESDSRPLHLCPVDYRKLQRSIAFDPVERAQRLLGYYRREGFAEEARWMERRLEVLAAAAR
jgi:archaemetzincin